MNGYFEKIAEESFEDELRLIAEDAPKPTFGEVAANILSPTILGPLGYAVPASLMASKVKEGYKGEAAIRGAGSPLAGNLAGTIGGGLGGLLLGGGIGAILGRGRPEAANYGALIASILGAATGGLYGTYKGVEHAKRKLYEKGAFLDKESALKNIAGCAFIEEIEKLSGNLPKSGDPMPKIQNLTGKSTAPNIRMKIPASK